VSYYTPSTPAIERSPTAPGNMPTLVCRSCGDTMQHLRTIPKLGARRETLIFVCHSCEGFDTKEMRPTNPNPPLNQAPQATKPSEIRDVNFIASGALCFQGV
jgi:predicted metal-binding protein